MAQALTDRVMIIHRYSTGSSHTILPVVWRQVLHTVKYSTRLTNNTQHKKFWFRWRRHAKWHQRLWIYRLAPCTSIQDFCCHRCTWHFLHIHVCGLQCPVIALSCQTFMPSNVILLGANTARLDFSNRRQELTMGLITISPSTDWQYCTNKRHNNFYQLPRLKFMIGVNNTFRVCSCFTKMGLRQRYKHCVWPLLLWYFPGR